MRIMTVYYRNSHAGYDRLLRTWEYSVRKYGGADHVDIIRAPLPDPIEGEPWYIPVSHDKLKRQLEYVEKYREDVVVMDGDAIIQRSLKPAFGEEFDVAVTMRKSGKINAGVVFVRGTEAARGIMRQWQECDSMLMNDRALYAELTERYHGQNQSAYGLMMRDYAWPGTILEMPCRIWNHVEWDFFDSKEAAIIHVKGRLRRAALSDKPTAKIKRPLRQAAEIWRAMEARA